MNELTFLSRITLATGAYAKQDAQEIFALNDTLSRHDLILSPTDALELSQCRLTSLQQNARIEVGLGAVGKLIKRFSASTFASPESWASLLLELTDCFYFVKTEVHDAISDDALLDFMFDEFEHFCGGSTEILSERCDWLIRTTNGDQTDDLREGFYDE